MSDRMSRDTFRDRRGTEVERGSEEDYYPEDAYSPWKKNNMDSFMSNMSKSSGLLLVIIGAGVFILVALFVFLPMLRDPADTRPIAEVEAKLKKMESKLTEMEQNYQKVAQLALQEDKLDQVSSRLEKLAATTTQRLDLMTKEIEMIQKQPALHKPESAPKPPAAQEKTEPVPKPPTATKTETASSSKPVETPEKKSATEKYHEVKPQETLYGLGKMYGVSIDELRRMNNMGPTEMVRTGQKLKVSK